MPALILKKIPGKPPLQNYLAEPDKLKGMKGEISRILVAPPIVGSPYKAMQVWKYRPVLLCKRLIFHHVLPEAIMCN
jgi:hypothetical protein